MRDVVVIGGGLSGLAAAYELEQQHIDYTLIEVKRQLGGSIRTVERDGFVMDTGAFLLADNLDKTWLDSLGLADALYDVKAGIVAFKQGTGALIRALEAKLTAPRLMRMAVSSIGELENGRCSICLENGIVLDAGALIIAVPARYAQRLFYGYITPITEHLLDYHYDTIHRIALGFRTADIASEILPPPDMGIVYVHRTEHPARVPDGHTLLEFGVRIAPHETISQEAIVQMLRHTFALPEPVTAALGYWSEADPLSCYDDHHPQWLQTLREQLPPRVALIGSDYVLHPPARQGIARLDERIAQGRAAARQFANR
jgi:protoporphyrinogen oxidase